MNQSTRWLVPAASLLVLILAATSVVTVASEADPERQDAVRPMMPRADDPGRLSLRFDTSPPYFAQIDAEATHVANVGGHEIKQRLDQTWYLQFTQQGLDERGHGLLSLKIIGIKTSVALGGTVLASSTAGPLKLAANWKMPNSNSLWTRRT